MRESLVEGGRAMVHHVDVCAVRGACDEAGVGAAQTDFVRCLVCGVSCAELEVVLGVSRVGVEFLEFSLQRFYVFDLH